MKFSSVFKSVLLVTLISLVGCETVSKTASKTFSAIGNTFSSSNKNIQTYRATGYAPVSKQPGHTVGEKVINAIRASKLRAYQELAAMIHGQYITSSSTVKDMVLVNDDFKTAVAGIVRGARVVKSYPIQDDVYATILEVNSNQLQQAWIVNNN
ncbi:MAG: LPP20 family lipoprotein [Oceanospirillaceae bacterium]|nr:LPP20 family lipoprotein [Oceanospirillaceae bacterium]